MGLPVGNHLNVNRLAFGYWKPWHVTAAQPLKTQATCRAERSYVKTVANIAVELVHSNGKGTLSKWTPRAF